MFSGRFRLLQPKFVAAFQELARLATKRGVEGGALVIDGLLVALSKADIVRRGTELGVDYSMTVWCYQADGDGRACGRGDSCRLRRGGFAAAGVPDSTRYVVRN
jgi:7-cyano-7-deazaguanine synthase